MRRTALIFTIAFGVLAAAPDVRAGDLPRSESLEIWQRYVVAQKRFQHDLYEILSRRWPELSPTLLRQRDEQLALIEMKDMKFRWLVENDPTRIVTDQGLSAFANFEWTNADTEALRAANRQYISLEGFLEHTRETVREDERTIVARERLASLTSDAQYTDLLRRFGQYTDRLGAELR